MTRVTAYFYGQPGGSLDKACRSIFEARGAESIGAGTDLTTGERDVEYAVPANRVEEVKGALKKAGFRLEPTP